MTIGLLRHSARAVVDPAETVFGDCYRALRRMCWRVNGACVGE